MSMNPVFSPTHSQSSTVMSGQLHLYAVYDSSMITTRTYENTSTFVTFALTRLRVNSAPTLNLYGDKINTSGNRLKDVHTMNNTRMHQRT